MQWPNIFKAAPLRGRNDPPVQPETFYLNSGIGVAIVQWNEHIAAESAMKHPIVYRALNKIAESVQQVPWVVQIDPKAPEADKAGKTKFMASLQATLDSPNEEMTPAMLRYWMALNYASYGRVPLRFSQSAIDKKRINGIYPLEAKHVRVHLNARGIAKAYEYGSGESKVMYPSRATYQVESGSGFADQIWKPAFKGFQHKDERNSPLGAVGLPAQVVKSLLMRAIQTAEGHPNVRYLVTASKTLTAAQKQALQQHLNEDHGPRGPDAGKVPILTNAGDVTIHTLDNDLSDIHSKMPSDDMSRIIFGAFGIPIALAGMGAADGAKFAGNYVESRQSFWQDTIIPAQVSPLFQGLTRMLCPAGVIIAPDLSQIPALQAGRVLSMGQASKVSFLTTDEKRELFGLPPAPDGFEETKPTATNGGTNVQSNT